MGFPEMGHVALHFFSPAAAQAAGHVLPQPAALSLAARHWELFAQGASFLSALTPYVKPMTRRTAAPAERNFAIVESPFFAQAISNDTLSASGPRWTISPNSIPLSVGTLHGKAVESDDIGRKSHLFSQHPFGRAARALPHRMVWRSTLRPQANRKAELAARSTPKYLHVQTTLAGSCPDHAHMLDGSNIDLKLSVDSSIFDVGMAHYVIDLARAVLSSRRRTAT